MSFRRKVPNAETAQVWLDAAEQSGLTRVEWCAQAEVDAQTLQVWLLAPARRARWFKSWSKFYEPSSSAAQPGATTRLRVQGR